VSSKTFVGTVTLPIMAASNDTINEGILLNVLTSEVPYSTRENMVGTLHDRYYHSYTTKVDAAMNYARDFYTLNLPSGKTTNAKLLDIPSLKNIIKTSVGYAYDIFIQKYEYLPFTPFIAAQEYLYNTMGMDVTEVITDIPEWMEFHSSEEPLEKRIVVEAINAGGAGQITIEYHLESYRGVRRYRTEEWGDGNTREIAYISMEWVEDINSPYIESIAIPAKYSHLSFGDNILSVIAYPFTEAGDLITDMYNWVYRVSDNTYPSLNPDNIATAVDEFMPVIPIRYNNIDLTEDNGSDLYKTSRQLVQHLGMTFSGLGEMINSNPDIAEIDHAYLMFGVNIQTNFVPALQYLSDFFDLQYENQTSSESEFNAAIANSDEYLNHYTRFNVRNTDLVDNMTQANFKEHGLDLNLSFDYITRTHSFETLGTGKIGHTTKEIIPYDITINYKRTGHHEDSIQEVSEIVTLYKLILRTQVSTGIIRTLTIFNPVVINTVLKDYTIVTSLKEVIASTDENNFVIPLQYNLTKTYTWKDRNILYQDSTLLVINTIKKVKLKWYQTRWFKAIVMVVAMIAAIYSAGTAGYAIYTAYTVGATVAGLVIGAGLIAAIAVAAQWAIIAFVIKSIIDFIIKEYGETIGIIGAIVMTIAATIIGQGHTALGITKEFALTTASYMIQGATALISSANEFLVEKGQKIEKRYLDFRSEMDVLWDELNETKELLFMQSALNPLEYITKPRLQIVPNESPTVFFSRCIDLPNNTMYVIHDEIYNFYDMRLKLDKNISNEMYSMNSYV